MSLINKSMNNVFMKAKEIKIGDNVWGHNLVETISRKEEENGQFVVYTFNEGKVSSWKMDGEEEVMVSNR